MVQEAAWAEGVTEILNDSKINLLHTYLIHFMKQQLYYLIHFMKILFMAHTPPVCGGFERLKREARGKKGFTTLSTCFFKFIHWGVFS